MNMFFIVSYFVFFFYISDPVSAYDVHQSQISVWLSGAAYCDKEHYDSMIVGGPAHNFELAAILYDPKTDLQGFTGINKSEQTIYVAFRGSSSILNWIDDAEAVRITYDTFPDCDCSVHSGFYKATNHLKKGTIESVIKLQQKYGFHNVVVTGHSLGAAIAQLISMELYAVNIDNQVFNFGQPRIGNSDYAAFVNKLTAGILWRFTHNKDPVPHIPFTSLGYLHACREVFEQESGVLTECSNTNCEDPSCANQYSFSKTKASDHEYYLEHYLDCEASTE